MVCTEISKVSYKLHRETHLDVYAGSQKIERGAANCSATARSEGDARGEVGVFRGSVIGFNRTESIGLRLGEGMVSNRDEGDLRQRVKYDCSLGAVGDGRVVFVCRGGVSRQAGEGLLVPFWHLGVALTASHVARH